MALKYSDYVYIAAGSLGLISVDQFFIAAHPTIAGYFALGSLIGMFVYKALEAKGD